MDNRNYKIVNLRAFAILTVVFGHSIILYSGSWNLLQATQTCTFLDTTKDVINLYQMELYFLISGFLFYRTIIKNGDYFSFYRKKALRLIAPYLLFGLFWMIPIKVLLDVPSYNVASVADFVLLVERFLLGKECGHLWFLLSLFWLFVVLFPLNKLAVKYPLGGAILIPLFVLSIKTPSFNILCLSTAFKYAFWFQLGVFMNNWKTLKLPLTLAIVSIMALFFHRLFFLATLIVVLLLYYLVPDKQNTIMRDIDRKSFGIYLIHSPLIYITYTYIPNVSPVIIVFCNFVVAGSIAYVITSIIINSRINRYLGL